jgi:hypothetical protein
MYIPENEDFLETISLSLNKESDFIKNIFIKFFMCIPYICEEKLTNKNFKKDHQYILVYLLCSIDKKEQLEEDQITALIFLIFTYFLDDWGCGTEEMYPALTKYSSQEFSNICIQFGLFFSSHLIKIVQNPKFMDLWKNKCVDCLNNNVFLTEKQLLLKEININFNKSLNARYSTKRTKRNIKK